MLRDHSVITFNEVLRDLRLFKARVYRFQKSLLDHVLAECLEVKYFQGKDLSSFTQKEITQFLTAIREGKEKKLNREEIAEIEEINLNDELNKRLIFEQQQKLLQEPEKVVYIIGSPRSGTSYLYNLLAYQGCFAYFSDISHYRWSLFNYLNRTRLLYHEADVTILSKDSKSLKVQSEFIIPSECEDIFQRAIQVYDHVKGHEYILKRPAIKTNIDLLKLNIKKHLKIFNKVTFLSKSPFNSFRIQQLKDAYPSSYFIHIYRNGYDVSHSIRENCFHYYHPTLPSHTPEDYWSMHIEEILEHSPKDKSFLLSYEKLCSHPRSSLAALFEWLQIKQEDVFLANHPYTSLAKKKEQIELNPQIEAYHSRLLSTGNFYGR